MKPSNLAAIGLVIGSACGGGGGPPHWSKQPLEAMAGTIKGKAFTVDLPKGSRQGRGDTTYSVEFNYHADRGGEDYVFAPTVSVGWDDKKQTLEQASASDVTHKKTLLDSVTTADGWAYAVENDAYPGKDDYIISGERYVGDAAFSCNVRIFPMSEGESVKALIPQAEAICASIKAK